MKKRKIVARCGPASQASRVKSANQIFDTPEVWPITPNLTEASLDARVIDWLRYVIPSVRRYGSICSGAFLLAKAGLLNGRRVTTHRAVADRLAQAFPSVTVDLDAIHVRDGRLRTAAGVTAGLDLSLALVDEDLGREVAMKVAGQLIVFFKRPGGQLQFSHKGEAAPLARSALQEAQRWIAGITLSNEDTMLREHLTGEYVRYSG